MLTSVAEQFNVTEEAVVAPFEGDVNVTVIANVAGKNKSNIRIVMIRPLFII